MKRNHAFQSAANQMSPPEGPSRNIQETKTKKNVNKRS
jgi:hypothetical protein